MSASETHTAANRFRFLAEAVAWRYRAQGFVVRWRVHKKLLRDPLYRELVAAGRLPTEGLVLDLGCGRGVFLALLVGAQALGMGGGGKRGAKLSLMGIEPRPELAESARLALAGQAEIVTADPRHAVLPACRTAVLLDVLLHLEREEQDRLLERLAAALEEGGRLILREPDAGAVGQWIIMRFWTGLPGGGRRPRPHPRSGEEWQKRLESLGLQVESRVAESWMGFSKVLLTARKIG